MAFNLQYLSKDGQSQELNKTFNSSTGLVAAQSPQGWKYNASAGGSNDAAATVEASGYFNGALGYLSPGDVIYVYSNDPAYHHLAVATNNGTTVTTSVIA